MQLLVIPRPIKTSVTSSFLRPCLRPARVSVSDPGLQFRCLLLRTYPRFRCYIYTVRYLVHHGLHRPFIYLAFLYPSRAPPPVPRPLSYSPPLSLIAFFLSHLFLLASSSVPRSLPLVRNLSSASIPPPHSSSPLRSPSSATFSGSSYLLVLG